VLRLNEPCRVRLPSQASRQSVRRRPVPARRRGAVAGVPLIRDTGGTLTSGGSRAPRVYLSETMPRDVYLIDGTYELFRHHHALPSAKDVDGREIAAVRGVVGSLRALIHGGATHLAVATDHVIESFRNRLWPGYKTGDGVPPDLLAQFPLLEEALAAYGITVWPMVEYEADDALAAAASRAARDPQVARVLICTPDKDLAQCVRGTRVVQMDRRKRLIRDEAGVIAKFGVPPASIPDFLALVGDAADGYPGLPGWGPKSAAAVLARYAHIESIPGNPRVWDVDLKNASALGNTLAHGRDLALLFRDLATLRTDIPLFDTVEALRWMGPTPAYAAFAARFASARTASTPGVLPQTHRTG
jgi:5'-3' exonuclease